MAYELRCREIRPSDIAALVELLLMSFPERRRETWELAFARLAAHSASPGYPQFGQMMEFRDRPVGLVLTCFTTTVASSRTIVRCNLSSWCVLPEFRGYAAMLSQRAMSRREVTYLNITPAPGTFEIVAAQGYKRYCSGVVLAVPAIGGWSRAKVSRHDGQPCADLSPYENRLLGDHAGYGCIAVTCSAEGACHPFVFSPNRTCRAPAAYLTYCRDINDFVRFAAPLGRFLARHGHPMVMLDANGPIPGLIGRYYDGWPKFFKGPHQPRLGDLAYTERPLFGF